MPIITDDEFGEIVVSKHSKSSAISLRIAPDGRLKITMPTYAPLFSAKALVKTSHSQIRQLLNERQKSLAYLQDQTIGKSHHLLFQTTTDASKITLHGTQIIAKINQHDNIQSPEIQQQIRQKIVTALRKEAKSYLPRRLKFLAEKYDFYYQNTKITHASSRWGSCSSRGTISLNIGLMNLPFELIDYVIIHELCHTRHMNHSTDFWQEVERYDPDYKSHRTTLKQHSPNI